MVGFGHILSAGGRAGHGGQMPQGYEAVIRFFGQLQHESGLNLSCIEDSTGTFGVNGLNYDRNGPWYPHTVMLLCNAAHATNIPANGKDYSRLHQP